MSLPGSGKVHAQKHTSLSVDETHACLQPIGLSKTQSFLLAAPLHWDIVACSRGDAGSRAMADAVDTFWRWANKPLDDNHAIWPRGTY
jgi:hypothetical protein